MRWGTQWILGTLPVLSNTTCCLMPIKVLRRMFVSVVGMVIFACAGALAATPVEMCRAVKNATYDGVYRLPGSAFNVYRASVTGMDDIRGVSMPAKSDFPAPGSTMQFVYVMPPPDENSDPYLLGCLHTTDGHTYTNTIDTEGGMSPVVTSVFNIEMTHGLGEALVMIVRWETASALSSIDTSGYLYEVRVYGKDMSGNDWNELGYIDSKFNGNTSLDGKVEGKKSVYPYTNKERVMKRLHELGYIDK